VDNISNKIEYLQLSVNNLEELVKLIKLYENVFEMEPFQYPSHDYLEKILKNENTLFVVAKYEEEIIGGLTAHQLASTYFEANEVYVYDLAVHQEFQRKGVGTRLIEELKKISCSKGDKEIFLQADIPDEYAIDFYKKIGGVPEDVIHFSFACKENKKSKKG
jgi:ribosomal protein S18 acetylase RimI-like enzyme